eukprot:CAMPEP_0173423202 /NCGR_PEP_ID=MMETSP1357-20121228/3605_1 /TAXON_ID=77926 /ORGANISM="Hemiselmis rufescens, Strain PCC563" /LENGTH=156 /DNA_ID=CAMNT_0014386295 /DNA_START=336 /DNA_END=806 /DNA_ORIENTATION=-
MSKQARMEKARARASRVSRSWAEDHNRNHCSLENTVATANGGSGPQAAWRLPSTDDDEDQLDLGLGDCAFALCIEEPSCEGGWIGCGDASSASSAHAHYNVANPRATFEQASLSFPTYWTPCPTKWEALDRVTSVRASSAASAAPGPVDEEENPCV